MCRHATQELPPEPASAGAARRFMQNRAVEWDLIPLLPDAQLALTELVTNAVLHAATPLTVSVSCAEAILEIAVFDGSPTLPAVRAEGDSDGDEVSSRPHVRDAGAAARGRGLLLVDALVAVWGVGPQSDGKAVWARTPTPDGWPHAVGCPCDDPDALGRVVLASGKQVVHR